MACTRNGINKLEEINVMHLKVTGIYGVLEGFTLNSFIFALHIVVITSGLPLTVYNFQVARKDLSFIIWFSILSFPMFTSMANALLFFWNRGRISRIWQLCQLDCLDSCEMNDKATILNDFAKLTNRKSYTVMWLMSLNVLLWGVTVFLPKRADYMTAIDPNRTKGVTILDMYYPFEHDRWPYLHLVFGYEMITVISSSMLIITPLLHLQIFITMVCGQIHVLQYKVENMTHRFSTHLSGGSNGHIVNGLTENLTLFTPEQKTGKTIKSSENNSRFNKKSVQKELRNELIKVVKDYQKIAYLLQDLRKIYDTIVSFHMAVVVAAMCLVGFKILTTEKITVIETSRDVVYMLSLVGDILLFSYLGTILRHKSESLSTSLYKCDWLNADKDFKTDLLMFMMRVQQPFTLTAFKYIDIDFMAFLNVMKLSYTYYAALYNISTRE